MKNRYLAAFAFAGLIGMGACAADEGDVQFEETAPAFEDAPAAPEITPAPTTGDTMMMPPEADTTIVGDSAVEADSVVL